MKYNIRVVNKLTLVNFRRTYLVYKFGLREKKKAQKKIEIARMTEALMIDKNFEDINVLDICEAVSISNVTFFKYFPKKEDILSYMSEIWLYERWVNLNASVRPVGFSAIRQVFEDAGKLKNGSAILNTIIRDFTRVRPNTESGELSDCEKWCIHPRHVYQDVPSIEEQLSRGYDQALEAKEIKADVSKQSLIVLLITIYFGTPVVTHMADKSMEKTYDILLDLIYDFVSIK